MSQGTYLYFGGFELPNGNAAAHRVLANAKLLRELGFVVILVGVRKGGGAGLTRIASKVDGFEAWSIPYPKTKLQWARHLIGHRCLAQLLEMHAGNLAGIICYNYPALAQIRMFRECRRLNGKCIADVTEWYESSAGPIVVRYLRAADIWLRMRSANTRADGIIAISEMLGDFYRKKNLSVIEVPPLFDTEVFAKPIQPAINANTKRFIYVGNPFSDGRVNRNRSNVKDRLDACVQLFGRLAAEKWDFVFDIYGVDLAQYLIVFPEDRELINNARSNIRFHGRVENQMARKLIGESDFSIFIRDLTRVTLAGFPTKLAESLSLGTPVITSNYDNLRKFTNTPGLFLAKRGLEYDLVKSIMEMRRSDVEQLRGKTFKSKRFDFRSYVKPLKYFMESL